MLNRLSCKKQYTLAHAGQHISEAATPCLVSFSNSSMREEAPSSPGNSEKGSRDSQAYSPTENTSTHNLQEREVNLFPITSSIF